MIESDSEELPVRRYVWHVEHRGHLVAVNLDLHMTIEAPTWGVLYALIDDEERRRDRDNYHC